ncbi:MAG TPA: hypothetical protein VFH80_10455 [Solirubrobacteraceae bacterium]|nr:hypothetical protein [Solirubrobacteraceae bacterium]
MRDDPITLLERELVDAARRRAMVVDEPSHEPRGPWPALRPARRRSSLGAFAAVVLSGLAVVVALGALVSLHGRSASPARPTASAKPSSRQQLIDILGVLRRPQVPADLRILSQVTHLPQFVGTPDRALTRFATTTPWGEKLYFVPMRAVMAGRHVEQLSVFSLQGGGGAGTAASIDAGEGIGTQGGGGIPGTRVTLVVPDGVARVAFVLPRQPFPGQYGAPIYPHSLTVTAAARDNVVAVRIDRNVPGVQFPMIWYAADGHVIKRIGNLAAADRVVPTPQPGPETALSRAAERDPSTPNRVWVTPAVGGPHTNFKVHFQVLLNNADYSYRLSGTKCAAITVSGGGGGGTNDLRGRIWSDVVGAVQGQAWCPGTYHVSVSIMGGERRVVTYPARPFGTATFRVNR